MLADRITPSERAFAARTIYGEARGESHEGKVAVAHVILNRAHDPKKRYGGPTLTGVCMKPWQFSCWNKDDPNREKIMWLDVGDPRMEDCNMALNEALASTNDTRFAGIYHYKVTGSKADWAHGKTPALTIGRHEFYRNVDG